MFEVLVFKNQRIKGSNRDMDTLQHCPETAVDSHTHIIERPTDIQTGGIVGRPAHAEPTAPKPK